MTSMRAAVLRGPETCTSRTTPDPSPAARGARAGGLHGGLRLGHALLRPRPDAECQRGNLIGPSGAAYGWQRDGGRAEYLLAEERTCRPLPQPLSYIDGAWCPVASAPHTRRCSGSTSRVGTACSSPGLGPVGLSAAILAPAMGAGPVISSDVATDRLQQAVAAVADLTGGRGCSTTLDASGHPDARAGALACTSSRGRCAFVGEGGTVSFPVPDLLIHRQITVDGSWVRSAGHMADLLTNLVRWGLAPERIVTD